MNMKSTLLASVVVGMFFSMSATAASFGDHYDPYVTADEISAVPSMPTRAEQRLADHYDPYILADEIVVSESCDNPVKELLADSFDPYITFAQLETAEMNNKC